MIDADDVGKPGVSSIVDGKTPDGEVYGWSRWKNETF